MFLDFSGSCSNLFVNEVNLMKPDCFYFVVLFICCKFKFVDFNKSELFFIMKGPTGSIPGFMSDFKVFLQH